MSVKALYAGTFDPFTNGHHDIAIRSLQLFSSLSIVVAAPPEKPPFLPLERRVSMIGKVFQDESKISVVSWERLIVDFAKVHHIKAIVRGLRPTGDFDNEFQMATMNKNLNPQVETVFITTSGHNYYLSSSLVREIFLHHGDIKPFVPPAVYLEMKKIPQPPC